MKLPEESLLKAFLKIIVFDCFNSAKSRLLSFWQFGHSTVTIGGIEYLQRLGKYIADIVIGKHLIKAHYSFLLCFEKRNRQLTEVSYFA
jgi:hypothetical protein